MSTFYSQGDGAWSTVTNWDTNRGGGGTDPASADEAGMAGHTFIIQPGHDIEFDMDMSAWSGTTGIYALTIEGHATDPPGMLYSKYSAGGTYHLMIQGGSATANIISGTNVTPTTGGYGRLLANSDGVWANSTALPNDRKFIIEFRGTTAGKLQDQYLDVKLLCVNPTNRYVHVYGTKYTFDANTGVNTTNDTVDLGTTPPSAGTGIILVPASGATLPTGLSADLLYYVRTVSGNTCKLATTNADATIIDITAVGSGTINFLTEPSSGAGTDVLNVLEDVTADSPWSDTTGHNRAVLVDTNAQASYDQQRVTISDITDADTIQISATIDSAQAAGCLLFLSSRNISIRSNTTSSSQPIIDSTNTSRSTGNTYQCEIASMAGTGTTFYGYGINSGNLHTMSGVIYGASAGFMSSNRMTMSGIMIGCDTGFWYSNVATISGTIAGCSNASALSSSATFSGTIAGCSTAFNFGNGGIVSGTVRGGNDALYRAVGFSVTGTIYGVSEASDGAQFTSISGNVSGCNRFSNVICSAVISGNVLKNTTTFYDQATAVTVKRGASVDYTFSSTRNTIGHKTRVAVEENGGTADAAKVYDNMGDIIRTACDGATANYPDEDPDGDSGYAIEASNLQSNLSANDPLYLISDRSPHRIWMAAGTYTITYKVYSSFALADNELNIAATYISDDSPRTITRSVDSQAINAKTSDTDWTQTLAITITTAAAGWVYIDMYLVKYSAGGFVFVWPKPAVT